jgi:RND family efflux transporter MFP subunit
MRSNGLKLTLCGVALCAATSAVGLVAQTTPSPLPPSPLSSRMLANDEERGKTLPSKVVDQIGFSVPGLVSEVLVKEGDLVKKGQVLAKLDTTVEQSELDKQVFLLASNVQLEAAKAQRDLSKVKMDRAETLYKGSGGANGVGGAGSKSEFEEAQLEYTVSLLKVKLAEEETQSKKYDVAKLKSQIARMQVTAQSDGVVQKIDASPGEVADPQKPSMVVVVNDPLFVEVNLPSRMTLGMKVGETMQVRYLDEPGKWREAKVVFFDPVADASVGRQMVRLEMPNAEQRRAGQEIAVKLPANLAAAK